MAAEESVSSNSPRSGYDGGKVIDLMVKATVVLAAILYGCGFLVISIHLYSYGIAEMDPLRPRVLAAGIWFLCFATMPFVLAIEWRAFKLSSSSPRYEQWLRSPKRENFLREHEGWLRSRSTSSFFFAVSCFWLGMILANAFDLPVDAGLKGPSTGTILLAMVLCAVLVVADISERFPHSLAVLASLAFSGLVAFCGVRDLSSRGVSVASIALWFMICGFFAADEMRSRSLKLEIGDWRQSLALGVAAVAGFASFYYPHIKPSWGGGAPIPAIIYFAKDSPVLPGRSVSAKILDETDGGFYIVGGSDKKATFIPRSEVAMVYYSNDASGPFVIKAK